MRTKTGITKSNGKYADILKFLNKQFELNDAVIFNDAGEIMARKSSLDSRLPQSIPLFLKIVDKSQIRKKIGEFYAINFYSSKQKIIYGAIHYITVKQLLTSMHNGRQKIWKLHNIYQIIFNVNIKLEKRTYFLPSILMQWLGLLHILVSIQISFEMYIFYNYNFLD